jgi:hypothetical protein
MLLKIETIQVVPNTTGEPQNRVRSWTLFDHVERVRWGAVVPVGTALPPVPIADGEMMSYQVYSAGEEVAVGQAMLSLIDFDSPQGHQYLAVGGTAYLCNDNGKTLEIIRA